MYAHFVPHKLADGQKFLKIQHGQEIVKEVENVLYNIDIGDETWGFEYAPKKSVKVSSGGLKTSRQQEKSGFELKVKTILIYFCDASVLFIISSSHRAQRSKRRAILVVSDGCCLLSRYSCCTIMDRLID